MERGVHQGCLISCHLFNLVGQVLVYSLRSQGFFVWWGKHNPASLYADDGTLIVQNKSQLAAVISHIVEVGKFIGLTFNLDNTFAYNSKL